MSTLKVGTIQDHTNSNTAMSIDSSGRVTIPQRICFSAQYKTGGGGASVGDGLIVFNTADVNKGSGYDTSTGLFTAPVAGTYFFSFHGFCTSSSGGNKLASGTAFEMRFKKNNSDFDGQGRIYHIIDATNYSHVSINNIIELSANDTIGVNLTSSYFYASTTNGLNRFEGYLIG